MSAPLSITGCQALLGEPSAERSTVHEAMIEEISKMLLYEELARARIRDLEEGVRVGRRRRNARLARRWHRLARWAAQRADGFDH